MKQPGFTIGVILFLGFSIITPSLSLSNYTITVSSVAMVAKGLSRLHIAGAYIKDEYGKTVFLRGINFPFFVWWFKDHGTEQQIDYISSWNSNLVVFTNKDEWLTDSNVRTRLSNLIQWAEDRGMYSVISYHPTAGVTDVSDWASNDWNYWIDYWEEIATVYNGSTNVLYLPISEPYGISASLHQAKMRQVIDAIRAIDPDPIIIMEAITENSWYDIALNYEKDYPINRANLMFDYHDYWWNAQKATSKASIRNKATNVGAEWCLDNNRAVMVLDFNYDANLGTDGETWLRNAIEVMNEDGFAGWAHWGWMTPSDAGGQDWSEIQDYTTATPTTQGEIVREYLG